MPDTSTRRDLLDLATQVAGWAQGGEQVEAYVGRGRTTNVRVYEGSIEQMSVADSEGIGVRVVADGRQGFAYAGSLDESALRETLAEARDNAGFGTPDEFASVASPDGVDAADIDPWDERLASFPTERKIDLAIDLERLVRAGDPRIRGLESADYGDASGEAAIATSTGIRAWSRAGSCYLVAYSIAGEGDDTQTGYGVAVARSPEDLDVERCAREAVDRATRLLGATKPASERLTVVLEGPVTSDLLSIVSSTLSGDAVLKQRSLFADRLGEEVASPLLTLVEDPTDPAAFGAERFDDEGLATRRVPLIENGVLKGFLYNTYAGRRAGVPSTGSAARAGFKSTPGVGVRAIRLSPGDRSAAEIISSVDRGLLVTEVSGLHSGVNPVSGDFSVGASGVMIRGGELAEPAREMTIGSTIQRMLKDVVAVGNDVVWSHGDAAETTLAIADVSVSGT
ncbi:MAG TPA: TldD/PmbA family protein [Acidimicrobiales bacterium]|nr:TldD/PmbA family protein [Acidimicrobiales bacterium]